MIRNELELTPIEFPCPTMTRCTAKSCDGDTYTGPDYFSSSKFICRDVRRLISDHLNGTDCRALASTCRNMFSIISDNRYWFYRLQKDFYQNPLIGRLEATVTTQYKRKIVPITCFDVYSFRWGRLIRGFNDSHTGPRTLKGFLQRKYGHRILSLPIEIPDYWRNEYDNIQLPVSVWPLCVVEAAKLSNDSTYSLQNVVVRMCELYTDAELEEVLRNVPSRYGMFLDGGSSVTVRMSHIRLAHIWANASCGDEAL